MGFLAPNHKGMGLIQGSQTHQKPKVRFPVLESPGKQVRLLKTPEKLTGQFQKLHFSVENSQEFFGWVGTNLCRS